MADKYEPEKFEDGGPLQQRTSPMQQLEQKVNRAFLGAIYRLDEPEGGDR